MTEVRPEWYGVSLGHDSCRDVDTDDGVHRLLEYAPGYFDLVSFPDCEAKRALQRLSAKKAGKFGRVEDDAGPAKKKQKKRDA